MNITRLLRLIIDDCDVGNTELTIVFVIRHAIRRATGILSILFTVPYELRSEVLLRGVDLGVVSAFPRARGLARLGGPDAGHGRSAESSVAG